MTITLTRSPDSKSLIDRQAKAEFDAAVNAERERRLAAGVTITVTGYGDIPIQGRPEDSINLLALKDTARDMVAADITDAIIPFRDAVNTGHILTPAQMIDLADKAKVAASQIYAASWALKAADPQPEDPSEDAYWL